jgi:hypothetical protein
MDFRRSVLDQRQQRALVVVQRPLAAAAALGQPFGLASSGGRHLQASPI